jgi:hypothetical protein
MREELKDGQQIDAVGFIPTRDKRGYQLITQPYDPELNRIERREPDDDELEIELEEPGNDDEIVFEIREEPARPGRPSRPGRRVPGRPVAQKPCRPGRSCKSKYRRPKPVQDDDELVIEPELEIELEEPVLDVPIDKKMKERNRKKRLKIAQRQFQEEQVRRAEERANRPPEDYGIFRY